MRRLALLLTLVVLPAFAQDPSPAPSPATASPAPLSASGTIADGSSMVPSLATTLDGLTTDPIFANADVGLLVVDARTGEKVWGYGDDKALLPASTNKLLTAATAMRELGPSYRFPTWVMVDGAVDGNGVLNGDLYVKGQGDPTMVVERMYRMVMDIKLRGINEIKGSVYFDDGYFQDSTLIPGWTNEEDLSEGPTYFAPLGALSVNYNIAAIVVRPGASVGSQAFATFETPTDAVVLENKLTTGSTRSRKWIKLERKLDDATQKIATYTLTGNIPVDEAADTLYRSLADPLTNYVGTFATVARQEGLKVKGGFKPGPTPTAAKLLLKSESDPLVEILAQMNKMSNNFMAEQILRSVGAEKYGLPGTTAKGVQAVGEYLTSLGVAPDAFHVVNGSGLSRLTTIRPGVLTSVLVDMYRNPAYATEFLTTLSVGGRDGTLKYRFREDGMEGRVRGKSGTLDGVRCLAGYVEATDGKTYAFSFLVNNIEGASARAKTAHDRLVLALSGTGNNVADGDEGGGD